MATGAEGAEGAGVTGAGGGGGGQAPRLQDCDALGLVPAHLLSVSIFPSFRIQFTVAVWVPGPQLALQAP